MDFNRDSPLRMSHGDPRPALALQAFIVLCRFLDDSRKWWMGKWFDKLRDGRGGPSIIKGVREIMAPYPGRYG